MTEPGAASAEQFARPEQQKAAATLGMWVFLATEILFFGVLFTAYLISRVMYPDAFEAASRETDVVLGTLNTAMLLTSSLTMALAVHSAEAGWRRTLTLLLAVTALIGLAFLGVKALEYYKHYHHHLIPGLDFRHDGPHAQQIELFFILYFVMTGLHAIHVALGVGMLAVLAVMAARGRYSASYYTPVEMGGLYWHFVDVVWILLYPILYLVARV